LRSGTNGTLVTNALGAIRLDQATNAAVTFAEQPSRDGEAATGQGRRTALLPPATEMRLLVRRITSGRASQVQLVAYDRCGPWPTFVGGGVGAF